ncbi:MAG: hypothetical protein IJ194_06125 [Bacilli bacterium]|nr:hypothetical protein [Bacilli bacterium]
MAKINICTISDKAYATLIQENKLNDVLKRIQQEPLDGKWLKDELGLNEEIYVKKKFQIEDFELKGSPFGRYKEVDFENSKTLYERLNCLPRYILTNPKFWIWVEFEKGYQAARQVSAPETIVTLKNMWFQKNRRGLFFGIMSRCYFRVEMTYDVTLADPYELSKFVIEKPERFRNLTWRNSCSIPNLTRGVIKAEKDFLDLHPTLKNDIWEVLAKKLSAYLSINLADSHSEQDFYDVATKILEETILEGNYE